MSRNPCNKKVIAQAAVKLKEDPKLVKDVVEHAFGFVAKTIRRGGYEGVEIPNFGRFTAKLKYVQTMSYHRMIPHPKKPKAQ